MVCDGKVGGSGYHPQQYKPNLNPNQKGVPGLKENLSKMGTQPYYSGTTSDNKALFQYKYKDNGELTGTRFMVIRDNTSGAVTYRYKTKIDGQSTIVHAYDNDGDGNIDSYSLRNNKSADRVFVNPKDDGSANFQMQQPESKGFSWNPLDWFK
mgnify:CR=1 FL=1